MTTSGSGLRFHPRCGHLVRLSACGKIASRENAAQEFNHGLVISHKPLQDNQIFEVRIDRKINSWSGSIELGVTSCDPELLETPFPSSATELRQGSWIMSGNSILKDGRSINENYGTDLDKLEQNDRVGVLRTSNGDLIFFVNGVSQSVAARNLPDRVFAVVDMYGKCAQVTLMDNSVQEARILSNAITNEATAAATSHNHNQLNMLGNQSNQNNITNTNIAAMTSSTQSSSSSTSRHRNPSNSHKIHFHERKGLLVKLSNNNRTAERRRPYDEFNNGVVMTHRPLKDNELFEIRIDRLVEKWSGSIEVGITTLCPSALEFPATMTNCKTGTMMMSGCGILTNGRGTRREYGDFNLDELQEGDRIGMIRKSGGNLHFYINGQDQGVAATKVPQQMWGVIDLYGMTIKVTIVDRDERDEQNLITRRNLVMREQQHLSLKSELKQESLQQGRRLLFHPNCGSHAAVMNGGLTAHRPNASDDFNFGVVLTARHLKVNEVFEVRLDKMVAKWAGSIEIGLTTHSPTDLEFPSTMTNIRSGTWMMTGNGVMHNGTTVIDDYGQNLDKLKVGDRVAVVRKESGVIHFFVNSEDQGPAATNVPECVYGVIDLYGQAAQASIIDLADFHSPGGDSDGTSATIYSQQLDTNDLRFHHLHGRNARISNNGVTASRPNALGEFNDAIIITNRPLKDGELFEIVIERTVGRWSGSIEAGVTLIRPEDLEFPNTMTDIDYETWMLSGSAVMQDGQTIRNGYCCDLDTLPAGSRLGMIRHMDGSLHYTINGEDQGVACENIPSNVYGVVDLYGQCAQVSIYHGSTYMAMLRENSVDSSQILECSQMLENPHFSNGISCSEIAHRFCKSSLGRGLELKNTFQTCQRPVKVDSGLVLGKNALEKDEIEVKIGQMDSRFAGSFRFGLTSKTNGDEKFSLMTSLEELVLSSESSCWLEHSSVKVNGEVVRVNYCPSLDRLEVGDKVGLRRTAEGNVRFLINGDDFGIAVSNLPKKLYPVFELAGRVTSISICSSSSLIQQQQYLSPGNVDTQTSLRAVSFSKSQESLEVVKEEELEEPLSFHSNHGRNVTLKNQGQLAERNESYNQGIVMTNRPLAKNEIFRVSLEKLNSYWTSSLMVGVLRNNQNVVDKLHLPLTALGFKHGSVVVCEDSIFQNGTKLNDKQCYNLDLLKRGQTVGLMLDNESSIRLFVNEIDQGVICDKVSGPVYGLVDLYGKCQEVSIVSGKNEIESNLEEESEVKEEKKCFVIEKITISDLVVRNCEYMNLCKRFKQSLGLPSAYFNPSCLTCYCPTCSKMRGDHLTVRKGDPPAVCATPFDWCRFGFSSSEASQNWHVAFHSTSPSALRRFLDNGELTPIGEIGLEQRSRRPKSKEDDTDAPQQIFSPSAKYIQMLCRTFKFRDKKTRREYAAQIAIEVEVQPGSYKVGVPRSSIREQRNPDSSFKLEEIEWSTKERGNTVMKALLTFVRLSD